MIKLLRTGVHVCGRISGNKLRSNNSMTADECMNECRQLPDEGVYKSSVGIFLLS
jgi:hypothetical protein